MKNDLTHLKEVAKKVAKVFPTPLQLSKFICEISESYVCLSCNGDMKAILTDSFHPIDDTILSLNKLLLVYVNSEKELSKDLKMKGIESWVEKLYTTFGPAKLAKNFIQLYSLILLDNEDAPITELGRKEMFATAISLYTVFIFSETKEVQNG